MLDPSQHLALLLIPGPAVLYLTNACIVQEAVLHL